MKECGLRALKGDRCREGPARVIGLDSLEQVANEVTSRVASARAAAKQRHLAWHRAPPAALVLLHSLHREMLTGLRIPAQKMLGAGDGLA